MTRTHLSRAFAVLAAALLIVAVAIASLAPEDFSVLDAVRFAHPHAAESLHRAFLHAPGPWSWSRLVQPLLVRPLWLVPASLGLLCVGGAATLNAPPARPHRKRS